MPDGRIQVNMNITKTGTNLVYQSKPTSFNITIDGERGFIPGGFVATEEGVDVSWGNLVSPAYATIYNMSSEFRVIYGIYDPETDRFFPVHEVKPGEIYPCCFAAEMFVDYDGTGTGTSAATNTLRFKAIGGPADVVLLAFER